MFLVSLASIQEMNPSFNPVILWNIWCYISYKKKQYFGDQASISLFGEWWPRAHFIFLSPLYKKNRKSKFSFKIIEKMGYDFLILKRVAKI